jgi:hypothetical protein
MALPQKMGEVSLVSIGNRAKPLFFVGLFEASGVGSSSEKLFSRLPWRRPLTHQNGPMDGNPEADSGEPRTTFKVHSGARSGGKKFLMLTVQCRRLTISAHWLEALPFS